MIWYIYAFEDTKAQLLAHQATVTGDAQAKDLLVDHWQRNGFRVKVTEES